MQEKMQEKSNRRRLKNLLINPEQQIQYGTLFLAVSIAVHAVATGLVYAVYVAWRDDLIDISQGSMWSMVAGMMVVYLLLFIFSFVLGLMISHRIYGPLVAFQHHFDAVKKGDFSSRVVLRKLDDVKLKELAEMVNQMTIRLGEAGKKL